MRIIRSLWNYYKIIEYKFIYKLIKKIVKLSAILQKKKLKIREVELSKWAIGPRRAGP